MICFRYGMTMLGIRFDLRVPPFTGSSHGAAYRACLDQCEWADRLGFDVAVVSEHHGVEDGYLPAPITLAAAIAGRTKRIQLSIAALLLPLHDPVRIAEELAVVSLASGGRLSVVAGMGYRQEELDMAGVDRKERGRLLDEYVGVLRQAWTGEPFSWRGRTIRVTPKPDSPPMILIGGSTAAAARRAARLRAGFFPAIGDADLARLYEEECARLGFHEGFTSLPSGPGFVHVSEDPERAWEEIGPHALYDVQTYESWQPAGQRSAVTVAARTVDELRESGVYQILTPEETVELARAEGRLVLHPLMGGISPKVGWASLRLVEEKVLPALRS